MFKKLGFAFISMFLFATNVNASLMLGNDAIDRGVSDSWSNFVLGMTTEVFSMSATVTDWEVYADNDGTLGMLLLRNTTGENYEVVGADFETAVAGLNTFSFTADTGVADVLAGDILGLFIGTAKIDFDFGGSDFVNWCGSDGCITNPTQLDGGEIISLAGGAGGGGGNRIYSANVTAVPEPSIIALFGFGLLGIGFARRRKA
jgi:hypothetical protein